MAALRARINYAFWEFRDKRGGSIGVFLKNGDIRPERWLGFIDIDEARRLQRLKVGIPVRLQAEQYAAEGIGVAWTDFPAGHYAQGCLVNDGVYGVMESNVRVVCK